MNIFNCNNIYLGESMPNQYTKIPLHLENKKTPQTPLIKQQFTKAIFTILKDKLPTNPQEIEEIIKRLEKTS